MSFGWLDERIAAYKSKLTDMLPVYVSDYHFLIADNFKSIALIDKDVIKSSREGNKFEGSVWTAHEILIQNARDFLTLREQGTIPEDTPTPLWAVYAYHPRGFEGIDKIKLSRWFVQLWHDTLLQQEAANKTPVEPMD
jgi:hypothetical protein